jgi:phosphoglycolate phosphatase
MTVAPLVAVDLDGTVLDCRVRQVALAAELVREDGQPPLDEAAFWARKREGASTREALEALGVDEAASVRLAASWRAHVEDDGWLALDEVLPGAREALAALRGRGLRLMLVTARQRPEAVAAQLARLELTRLLGDVRCVDPAAAAERKAEVLRDEAAAAFVGDAESDAAAAERAGVPFVAVASGQRTPAFLRAHGCRTVVAGLAEAVDELAALASSPTLLGGSR